ncbi:hypothetical protein AB0N06_01370 [Streptomyces sp. NPDC051020]|uniref:hypothetical protein n=1 Tax=Streptomyces sp. NPDC051020 TaxID=3155409 RepID=UPI003426A877
MLVTTGPGGVGAGESVADDAGAVDDTEATGRGAASEGRPIRYMPPAAEPAGRTTAVIAADSTDVRTPGIGIGRDMERTLGRGPGSGLWRT